MGGITNQATLDTASTTFHAVWDEIFERGTPGLYSTFTEVISTDSKVNELDLLETMPVIRQWLGAKEFNAIRASSLSSTIKKYEKSLELDRLDVQSDRTGLIGRRIRAFLSQDGGQIYDKICTDRLLANPTCYDGAALFSASHPRGPSGNQSNTSTTALSFTQHDTVMQTGAAIRDANGEPLGIGYNVLMVGPKLQRLGMEITQSTERVVGIDSAGAVDSGTRLAAASIPNVWGPGSMIFGGGSMTLVINPRLVGTYDDYYYYFDATKAAKPIVLFEFRAPEPIEATSMDAEARFMLDKLRFSVECDVAAEPGAWQVAFGGLVA